MWSACQTICIQHPHTCDYIQLLLLSKITTCVGVGVRVCVSVLSIKFCKKRPIQIVVTTHNTMLFIIHSHDKHQTQETVKMV